MTSSTISRLKRIFDRLPRNDLESLLKMERLLDPSFNHQNYRTEFKDRSVPKIPFLPIIYKDLKFINSSRESYPKTDSMINFQPFAVLYEVLSSHLLSSDARYTFQAQYDFAFKEMGQFGKYTVSESYGPETLRIIGLCRLLSDRISFAKDVDSKDGQMNRARMIADSIS